MSENPYEPPRILGRSESAERPPTSRAKIAIILATAMLVGGVSCQGAVLATTLLSGAVGLPMIELSPGVPVKSLAVIPAALLTVWLACVTWRSERWDWWASVQIGASLTLLTILESLAALDIVEMMPWF